MNKNERIRTRVSIALMLALGLLLLAVVVGTQWFQRRDQRARVANHLRGVREMFDRQINSDAQTLGALMDVMAHNTLLQEAWLAKDRDLLLQRATPLLAENSHVARITHFDFHHLDGTCFLRLHDTESDGDHVDRLALTESLQTGERSHGIELGSLNTLTLLVVHPWRVDGKVVGYVELGEEIDHITSEMKSVLNAEFFVTLDKPRLDRETWEQGMRVKGRTGNWAEAKNFVVTDRTLPNLPPRIRQRLENHDHDPDGHLIRDSYGAIRYHGGCIPLVDREGVFVGRIVTLLDTTAEEAALRGLLTWLVVVGAGISGLLCCFFWKYLGRIEDRLIASQRGLELEIEERTKAEVELMRSRNTLQTILDRLPVGVVIIDGDQKVRQVNEAAVNLMGYTAADDLVGLPCKQTLCHHPKGGCPILGCRDNIQTVEHGSRDADGNDRTVLKTIVPLKFGGERVLMETFVDISHQKEIERDLWKNATALESASKSAEAATRAKSEFLANMSHEIRTPMTAILGYTNLLSDAYTSGQDLEPREMAQHLDTIKRNGEYLLELISDILDLSRIESGKLQVVRTACSPTEVLTEVAALMRVRSDAKRLVLKVEYDGPMPASIQCDAIRLRQILINIVGNAIKFTESGSVRIVAKLLDRENDSPHLRSRVIDTGIGMADSETARVFRPFTQVDSSTMKQFEGTGLGLTISRRLAKALGGDIVVQSTLGQGSTFDATVATGSLVDVPMLENAAKAAVPDEPEEKSPKTESIRLDCRILVVEDGPDNQRLIAFLLRKAGADVEIADNGQVGLDAALAATEAGSSFDCILMDIQMPIMDGYTATRHLREAGYTSPILALTANAMAGDDKKCRKAGCDAYLTKPIDPTTLLATIAEYTDTKSQRQST